jgi:hypothetical protein
VSSGLIGLAQGTECDSQSVGTGLKSHKVNGNSDRYFRVFTQYLKAKTGEVLPL